MSTWIFDRLTIKTIVAILLIAGLSACGSSRSGPARTPFAPAASAKSSTIEVSGRTIIVEGPRGFCVDQQASQIGRDNAFVLLGSCAAISRSGLGARPKVKALLTATISDGGQGSPGITDSMTSLDEFFRSETGRTALSRSSDPASVAVLDSFQNDETYFLRARDTSPGIVPDATDDYWRAYFDLNDQIVAVSVIGFKSDPLSPTDGLDTVQEFARLIRSRNGVSDTPLALATPIDEVATAPPAADPIRPAAARDPTGAFWSVGILRRVLR